jgi:hypothetical protein
MQLQYQICATNIGHIPKELAAKLAPHMIWYVYEAFVDEIKGVNIILMDAIYFIFQLK